MYILYFCSQSVSMDYNKPLIVPVGCDAIGQIGKYPPDTITHNTPLPE